MRVQKVLAVCAISIVCLCMLYVFKVVFLLGGSDFTTYPKEKASLWVCEDPHFEINYAGYISDTYFEWNGEKHFVFVALHANSFDVFRRSDDQVLREENMLLRGTWKYVGRSIVVEIQEDNIFDGAYTELVFIPQ